MTVHDWKEELLNNFGEQEELEGLVAREGAEQVRDVCKTSRCEWSREIVTKLRPKKNQISAKTGMKRAQHENSWKKCSKTWTR